MEKASLSKIENIVDQSKNKVTETRPLVSLNIPAFGSLDFFFYRAVFDLSFFCTVGVVSTRDFETMGKNLLQCKSNKRKGCEKSTYR